MTDENTWRQEEFEKHVAFLRATLGVWLSDADGERMAALMHVAAEMLAAFHMDVTEEKRSEIADSAFTAMRETHDDTLNAFDQEFALMESQGQAKH